jgi:hypothetical protein
MREELSIAISVGRPCWAGTWFHRQRLSWEAIGEPRPRPSAHSPGHARRTSAFQAGADLLDSCHRSTGSRRGRREFVGRLGTEERTCAHIVDAVKSAWTAGSPFGSCRVGRLCQPHGSKPTAMLLSRHRVIVAALQRGP